MDILIFKLIELESNHNILIYLSPSEKWFNSSFSTSFTPKMSLNWFASQSESL